MISAASSQSGNDEVGYSTPGRRPIRVLSDPMTPPPVSRSNVTVSNRVDALSIDVECCESKHGNMHGKAKHKENQHYLTSRR